MKTIKARVFYVDRQEWVDDVEVTEEDREGLPYYSLAGYRLDKAISPKPAFAAYKKDRA